MVRIVFLLVLIPQVVVGQLWDFSVPEKLSKEINTEYEEAFPLLTPDGKTLYFTRLLYPKNSGGRFSGPDIWVSRVEANQSWSTPANARDFDNDAGNNAVVGIDNTGQTVYFMNTTAARKANGIYFTRKMNNGWSKPELIPIDGVEPLGFLSFFVSPDFDVIFISMRGSDSRGEEDLYVTTKTTTNTWTKPKNLGSAVNTSGFEISPFLSPDKKRLYFASNGHKGFGDADIFYSDRLYNSWDTWSTPRNLGEKLNSKKFDAYFAIYGDSLAYFASNRAGRYSDLYKVAVVPGNDVLAFGQRYLTLDEMAKTLGSPNVSRRITFDNATVELTAQQKELLFFIANKLIREQSVNLHLAVMEDNDPKLAQQRLLAVANHLRVSGVDNVRIITTNNERVKKKDPIKTTIEILLFK